MPRHDGFHSGYSQWFRTHAIDGDADDESDEVRTDGYHKAVIEGWTPLYDIQDPEVHGSHGQIRDGEEDPRSSVYAAQRLAVALNLGPAERRNNPDAVAACIKEWVKLRENSCWDEYDIGQSATINGVAKTKREKDNGEK